MSWTSTDEKTFAVEERRRASPREQHSHIYRSIRAIVCSWSYECAIYNQCVESMQEMERNELAGPDFAEPLLPVKNVSFIIEIVAELKSFSLGVR